MYWIPTTIKGIWLNKILSGEKKIERKIRTKHWGPRMRNAQEELRAGRKVGISFLCGRQHVKFKVVRINDREDNVGIIIDNMRTTVWYDIHLGDQIK